MTIRKTIIIALLAIFTLGSGVMFLSSRAILATRFTGLEQKHVHANLVRAKAALLARQRHVDQIAADWADNGAAHAFAHGATPRYVQANIRPQTFAILDLHYIAILDQAGRVAWAGMIEEPGRGIVTDNPLIGQLIQKITPALRSGDGTRTSGILSMNGRVALGAAHAIHGVGIDGPKAGTLIMARWLDDREMNALAEETRLDLSLAPWVEEKAIPYTPPDTKDERIRIMTTDTDIAGFLALQDIGGSTAGYLKVRMEREINHEALIAARYNLFAQLITAVLCCVLGLLILEKKVLSRITSLSVQVGGLRSTRDISDIALDGNDELNILQRSINSLLQAIRQSEASYEIFFRSNGTANAILDTHGVIRLVNDEFERLAGQTKLELENKQFAEPFFPGIQAEAKVFTLSDPSCPSCSTAFETVFLGAGGERHVLASITTLPDRQRQILSLQDITPLKKSQAQLLELSRELEERVQARTADLKQVNLRLGEEVARRIATSRILEVVNEISRILSTANNTATAFRMLLDVLCGLEPFDYGAAYVLDASGSGFTLVADKGLNSSMRRAISQFSGESILAVTAQRGLPTYGLHADLTGKSSALTSEIKAVGMIPIVFQDRVVAILNVASRTVDDIPLPMRSILNTIAAQTGGAIVRIQAQETSERTAKEMRAIFETSAVGIMHLSASRHLLKVNGRLAEMFGYSREEMIGRHVQILHESPEASERFHADNYPDLLRGQRLLNQETRMKTKSGEIRWFKIHGGIIATGDPSQGFVWILEDIHDQRAQREALRRYTEELREAKELQEENGARLAMMIEELNAAKQQAESASRMKSDFLANVSHEIRTPMNAIMGMTDIVLGQAITRDQRRALTIVKNSAEELLDLINGVLDLSKIEAGQFELETRAFSPRDVVEKTVLTLALAAAEKNLDLICRVPPDLPRQMLGDPGRLRQVLINLMGNALKFTPSGHVCCRCHVDEETETEIVLHFEIQDTGIGIPREKQQIIFDDFTQVDSSSTRVYGGTGLGLSITKKLIHLMRGDIWVESSPGQGSAFHATTRLGKIEGRDTEFSQLFDHAATVLVVINNPQVRAHVVELLDFWGLDTLTGSCLDFPPDLQADLAILDPDMSATECLELLEPGRPLREIPTIIVTQLGDATAFDTLHPNIRGVLAKPVLHDDLLRLLAQIFGLRVHLEQEAATEIQPTRPNEKRLEILLVEDVATNRELAELLLRNMGHAVHDSRDGLDALTMLGRHSYDLIFMDLQMPVMDGFTATQIIRACEQGLPAPADMNDSFLIEELRRKIAGTHTPIVAMTAHAMLRDRQRCLDIGMDAYITKPLRLEEVHAVLDEISGAAPSRPAPKPESVPAPAPAPTSPPFDRALAALQSQYGLGQDQAIELIRSLETSLKNHQPEMEQAMAAEDIEGLRHLAHSIKGMLANMGLTLEAETAKNLENACAQGTALQDVITRAVELTELIMTLRTSLETTLKHRSSS
ncbi:MAG: PAS domain S-box protein [Deltaproteobacteria bacterium]|nr:PAS domain S-box protein [Deltaproteobacteria bacterium]